MTVELILRWTHVLGASVLFGTGIGIAFFMLRAHLTGNPAIIAHTAGTVVVADTVFTATAVVLQPITGLLLASVVGWPLSEPWIIAALALYVFVGLFWLPVVAIQLKMRNLAREAEQTGQPLPDRYHRLFRVWFACGVPAFGGVLLIFWLMLARPVLW